MAEEPKGFYSDLGVNVKRETPLCTRKGIVIYRGEEDLWYLEFPDTHKISHVTTIELINLIYYLNKTNGNLDKSRKQMGWK